MLKNSLIHFFVFLTGAAGLIYQVAWQRYLSRLLGNDSIATAIILATFLGGLSLGYYLCGKWSTRVRHHFKGYALLEGIIGVWGLLFPPFIFETVDTLTQTWGFTPPFWMMLQGVSCSAILMGLPTLCMGGTIPMLTRGISRSIGEATGVHARVYAINTAGAFLGTLLAGFWLIPHLGLPLTVMGAALLNLGACLFFYFMPSPSSRPEQAMSTAGPGETLEPSKDRRRTGGIFIFGGVAFLSGFYVMTLENVLIRISNLSFGSSSYSFSLIVSVFILAIAVGAYGVGRMHLIRPTALFYNQLCISLSLLLVYASLDLWPWGAHLIRTTFQSNILGFWGYYAGVFFSLLTVLIIPVGLMGATVPIVFHEMKRDLATVGKYSGIVLSINTVGSLAGSLIGGVVLYYVMNIPHVFLVAIFLASISVVLASLCLPRPFPAISVGITAIVLLITTTNPFFEKDRFLIGSFRIRGLVASALDGPKAFYAELNRGRRCLFSEDGPSGSVRVLENEPVSSLLQRRPRSIIINGKSDSSTVSDMVTLRLLTHIPALLAESRKRTLIIGLGTGVTVGEMTLYPDVESIDVAEISPSVIKALPYFREDTHDVHLNPKVTIHEGDAFRILRRSTQQWDIIVSEPTNPWVTGVDLLFTDEFYKLVKSRLTPSGLLLQWIHIYDANVKMFNMMVNTVLRTFETVHLFVATPGDVLLLAANRPFSPQDIGRARRNLNEFNEIRESMSFIHIDSIEALLMRELWSPLDSRSVVAGFGYNTLDNPSLHYMAGKAFFLGESVPWGFFLRPDSVGHRDQMMYLANPSWSDFAKPIQDLPALIPGLRDVVTGEPLWMAPSLKLRAHLTADYSLPEDDRKPLNPDLVRIMMGENDPPDWERVHLSEISYGERITALFRHICRTRNWIVPYPLKGFRTMLREGIQKGADACDRNLSLLLLAEVERQEGASPKEVKAILARGELDREGKWRLRNADRAFAEGLLKSLENWLRSPQDDERD